MFDFICDHIVPGCTHVETGDTREKVMEQALDHLSNAHGMEYIDDPLRERVSSVAIVIR